MLPTVSLNLNLQKKFRNYTTQHIQLDTNCRLKQFIKSNCGVLWWSNFFKILLITKKLELFCETNRRWWWRILKKRSGRCVFSLHQTFLHLQVQSFFSHFSVIFQSFFQCIRPCIAHVLFNNHAWFLKSTPFWTLYRDSGSLFMFWATFPRVWHWNLKMRIRFLHYVFPHDLCKLSENWQILIHVLQRFTG